MIYNEQLIEIRQRLCDPDGRYALILLSARALSLTLSGTRCFLDGKYILCLSAEDTVTVGGGGCEAVSICFEPYFYNVNLNHHLLGMELYDEMREKYGYPDFRLFRVREDDYIGIVPLAEEEYVAAARYFAAAATDLALHGRDEMWSCRVRSDMIAVLQVAQGAFFGKQGGEEIEVLRYIHSGIGGEMTLDSLCARFHTNRTTLARLIKEHTGMPPMQYVLKTRLEQSCPDLLFTRLPVHEIAAKYGFSEGNYYIRAFKKRYGVTPLRYRQAGIEARLRDEGIYHRRSEAEDCAMSLDDFAAYYEKGLGRVFLRLKRQSERGRYRQVLLTCMLEKRTPRRVLSTYEKELIDLIDDPDYTDRVAEHLLCALSETGESGGIPLLGMLGRRAQVEEIVEEQYRSAYAALLDYTKRPWDGDRYPPCADRYIKAVLALGEMKVGDLRIKQMISDMADLYEYSDSPVVPTWQSPLYRLWDIVGRDFFFLLQDEVVAEHPHGARIDLRKEVHFAPRERPSYPPMEDRALMEAIFSHNCMDKNVYPLLERFFEAGDGVKEAVAAAAIAERDPALRRYLLSYFAKTTPYYENPVPFPLDPTPLVQVAREEDYSTENREESPITPPLLEILRQKPFSAGRDMALEILAKERYGGRLRENALWIRFGTNYDPKRDVGDFVALIRSPDQAEAELGMQIMIRNLEQETPGLPLDLIPYVFANLPKRHDRLRLCQVLARRDMMPRELWEECRYDIDPKIRALAREQAT